MSRAIVIVADGLQPALVGAYGNEWIRTPTLDRLAAEGVTFDQHYADGPRTGIWTGRHAFPNVAPTSGLPLGPASSLPFFCRLEVGPAERLLWFETSRLLPPWEIADEFLEEAFADDSGEEEDEEPLEAWLAPPAGFLDPDDEALERLQRTAAAAVAAFDAELAAFVARPEIADALLIVTAGRGQALGEHGLIGAGRPWLHEELVHLPLLVRFPDGAQAGRRVMDLTQTVDVPATLMEWFGEPIPEDWHGRGLLGLARGGPAVRAYAVTGWKAGDAEEWALRLPEASLIVPKTVPPDDPPRGPMLFVKPDDRYEVNQMRMKYLDWAEELEATLWAYAEAAARPGPLVPPPLPEDE